MRKTACHGVRRAGGRRARPVVGLQQPRQGAGGQRPRSRYSGSMTALLVATYPFNGRWPCHVQRHDLRGEWRCLCHRNAGRTHNEAAERRAAGSRSGRPIPNSPAPTGLLRAWTERSYERHPAQQPGAGPRMLTAISTGATVLTPSQAMGGPDGLRLLVGQPLPAIGRQFRDDHWSPLSMTWARGSKPSPAASTTPVR
jgi:hypothetical protein